jgi:hypothetical protein
MRFALVDDKRSEAKSGLTGICPGCSQSVIAKCGKQRIHHWAHRSNKTCDNWWEPETDWHRSWKNHFPAEWQEVFLPDAQSGEKHIADIRTSHGLVIEFQHSHIDPHERIAREKFYKSMVWVVNGTRLKRDYPRFVKEQSDFRTTKWKDSFLVSFPEEHFPKEWLASSMPVLFDFKSDVVSTEPQDAWREPLWCLLPGRADNHAVVAAIGRQGFVNILLHSPQLFQIPAHEIVKSFANDMRQQRQQADIAADQLMEGIRRKAAWQQRYRSRRPPRFYSILTFILYIAA